MVISEDAVGAIALKERDALKEDVEDGREAPVSRSNNIASFWLEIVSWKSRCR